MRGWSLWGMWLKEIQPELHVIKNFLKKDKEIYGSGVHDRFAPEELNPWQQGVDDSLTETINDT